MVAVSQNALRDDSGSALNCVACIGDSAPKCTAKRNQLTKSCTVLQCIAITAYYGPMCVFSDILGCGILLVYLTGNEKVIR